MHLFLLMRQDVRPHPSQPHRMDGEATRLLRSLLCFTSGSGPGDRRGGMEEERRMGVCERLTEGYAGFRGDQPESSSV